MENGGKKTNNLSRKIKFKNNENAALRVDYNRAMFEWHAFNPC